MGYPLVITGAERVRGDCGGVMRYAVWIWGGVERSGGGECRKSRIQGVLLRFRYKKQKRCLLCLCLVRGVFVFVVFYYQSGKPRRCPLGCSELAFVAFQSLDPVQRLPRHALTCATFKLTCATFELTCAVLTENIQRGRRSPLLAKP